MFSRLCTSYLPFFKSFQIRICRNIYNINNINGNKIINRNSGRTSARRPERTKLDDRPSESHRFGRDVMLVCRLVLDFFFSRSPERSLCPRNLLLNIIENTSFYSWLTYRKLDSIGTCTYSVIFCSSVREFNADTARETTYFQRKLLIFVLVSDT